MFKFDFDDDEIRELLKDHIQNMADAALAQAANKGAAYAADMAKAVYSDKPYSFWKDGFGLERVGQGIFVMSLNTEMSELLDEGDMEGVRQKVLTGNRAKYNKQNGKRYVDVPFMKDADGAGNIQGTGLNVSAFKDADAMIQSFKQSTPLNKQKITQQKAVVRNVQDMLTKQNVKQTRGLASPKTSYVVIKRTSVDSQPWKDYENAPEVFGKNADKLINYIEQQFIKYLEMM